MVAEFDITAWLLGARSAPVALFHASPDGAIQAVNPAWTALTGLDAGQATDDGWLATLHADD